MTYVTFKNNLEVYAGLSEASKMECFNVTPVYNMMNVTPVCKKTSQNGETHYNL